MPIAKRPCSNCPFRNDGQGIELQPGRLEGIIQGMLSDDQQTFVCHKTLDKERKTCAGFVGVMSKLNRLPIIARLGITYGVITIADVRACENMVIEPADMKLMLAEGTGRTHSA